MQQTVICCGSACMLSDWAWLPWSGFNSRPAVLVICSSCSTRCSSQQELQPAAFSRSSCFGSSWRGTWSSTYYNQEMVPLCLKRRREEWAGKGESERQKSQKAMKGNEAKGFEKRENNREDSHCSPVVLVVTVQEEEVKGERREKSCNSCTSLTIHSQSGMKWKSVDFCSIGWCHFHSLVSRHERETQTSTCEGDLLRNIFSHVPLFFASSLSSDPQTVWVRQKTAIRDS